MSKKSTKSTETVETVVRGIPEAVEMAKSGATAAEIRDAFGITYANAYYYKRRYGGEATSEAA